MILANTQEHCHQQLQANREYKAVQINTYSSYLIYTICTIS